MLTLSPDAAQDEFQVTAIDSTDHTDEEMSITSFLQADPASTQLMSLEEEQRKDSSLVEVIRFLEEGVLPEDETRVRKLALQGDLYTIVGSTLYHLDAKRALQKQVVVPYHLRRRIMEKVHRGPMSAHFSGHRLFNTGGGRACLLMPSSLFRVVLSVWWCVVGEGCCILICIQSQCHVHFR